MQNVAFKVVGVLSTRGANMMGMDQDDIVLAPWTSIKDRVSSSALLTNINQSTAHRVPAPPRTASVNAATTVNSLNNTYPGTQDHLSDCRSATGRR